MFIGRVSELSALNERYDTGRLEMAVLYGRRRVGKTTLINAFTKGKETIFYTGIEGNAKENLEGLSRSIYALSEDFSDASGSFESFRDALETVFRIAESRRIILVLDEYPYVAASYKAISSLLQVLIDRHQETSKLFLILCGSSMSFMENQVLGYQSPLFGRRTCQFKIKPFGFFEMKEYFRKFSAVDLAMIYGITGGIPLYLSLMNEDLSVGENIKRNFLETNAYLFEEPTNLIKQECRDPAQYNSIIRAVAKGASRMSEISSKTDLDTALVANHLSKLTSLGIIKKETPLCGGSVRKSIYVLDDSMFRFWYRFIPEHMAAIQQGMQEMVFRQIEHGLPAFMGGVFEEICKQYLWNLNRQGKAAFVFGDLGRWWGNDPVNKREAEIDIVCSVDGQPAIFCECKWTNEKVDQGVLTALIAKGELFPPGKRHYYLFAKSGFAAGCVQKAAELSNVTLVAFEDMIHGKI